MLSLASTNEPLTWTLIWLGHVRKAQQQCLSECGLSLVILSLSVCYCCMQLLSNMKQNGASPPDAARRHQEARLSLQWVRVLPLTCSSCCVQGLDKGFQSMAPDIWLSAGNPWEVYRPELAYRIGFYGEVKDGKWTPSESVRIIRPRTSRQPSCGIS